MTSFVTEPLLTGLGAGGYMLVAAAGRRRRCCSTSSSRRPAAGADPAARAPLVAVDGRLRRRRRRSSTSAPSSCGVYGTPAGIARGGRALRHACRWPSSPRRRSRSPATGVEVNAQQALPVRAARADLAADAGVARALLLGGRVPREGDVRARPGARRHDRAARRPRARRRSTRGDIAAAVVGLGARARRRRSRAPTSPPTRRSRASRSASRYRGREVLTNPPPTAGGILIAYALALLERERRAARRRAQLVDGDGGGAGRAHAGVPRRARRARLPRARSWRSRLGSTTHVSVLDADGWACAVTCTNGEGSGIVVPGTGIHVNNMMGEQDLSPLGFFTHPPGRRLPSMMAPTVVLATARPSSCSAPRARTGSARRSCR